MFIIVTYATKCEKNPNENGEIKSTNLPTGYHINMRRHKKKKNIMSRHNVCLYQWILYRYWLFKVMIYSPLN